MLALSPTYDEVGVSSRDGSMVARKTRLERALGGVGGVGGRRVRAPRQDTVTSVMTSPGSWAWLIHALGHKICKG